jgi:hypothetical protein
MSFADIAYERLNKTAPELFALTVSFQDMSEELGDTAGINLGVFTLRSGGSLFFIPVIAKGHNVYPMDGIFSDTEKKFFPLSKLGIAKVKNSVQTSVGKGQKIPTTVDRNPSLRELVEPPRTGKYTYAGGRVTELRATAPEGLKQAVLEKIATDKELVKGLHKVGFDVREILSSLKPIEKAALEIAPEVSVITDGQNLSDNIVQTILDQGYAIIGEHREPRVVIEASSSNEGYTTLKTAQPGCAYEIVLKSGLTRLGFVPKGIPQGGLGLGPEGQSVSGLHPAKPLDKPSVPHMLLLENGDYAYSTEAVIIDAQRDYIEVVKNVVDSGSYVDLEAIEGSCCTFVLVTPNGCVGPLSMNNKVITSSGTTLEAYHQTHGKKVSIVILPNMTSSICMDGNTIYVSPSAKAIILNKVVSDEIEKDVNAAYRRKEAKVHDLLKEAHTLTCDGVEFYYDGKPIEKEAELAKTLVVNEGISKEATVSLIKKAIADSKVVFYMSKKAYVGANPTPFPQYGSPPPEEDGDPNSSRTKKQATKIADSIKSSLGTRDKQVVEATIISQFINDPNMYETVESYLPDIKEAVDKLGRSIVLFRIHSDKVSEDLQSEELSDLITALRSTFKTLGDNSIRLENLTNNVREHG